MGWYGDYGRGRTTAKQAFEEIKRECYRGVVEIEKESHRSFGKRIWTLVKEVNGYRIDLFLMRRHKENGGYWMYKPMTTADGPYYFDCPKKWLDLPNMYEGQKYHEDWLKTAKGTKE